MNNQLPPPLPKEKLSTILYQNKFIWISGIALVFSICYALVFPSGRYEIIKKESFYSGQEHSPTMYLLDTKHGTTWEFCEGWKKQRFWSN